MVPVTLNKAKLGEGFVNLYNMICNPVYLYSNNRPL